MRTPTPASVCLLVVACTACGGAQTVEHDASGSVGPRYGISVVAPEGWSARILRGALFAATHPLPSGETHDLWEMARAELDEDDIRLVLAESAPENRSPPIEISLYRELARPPRFDEGDFRREDVGGGLTQLGARRMFRLSGRPFVAFVEVGSLPPAPDALAELNTLLASLEVAPADFYPGTYEPPRFVPRPGWHVGDSGVAEVGSEDELATAWASTVVYRDEWNAGPSRTLERLPEDGIVIWLWLTRAGRFPPSGSAFDPATGLDAFDRTEEWPGRVRRDIVLYRFAGVAGDKQVDLQVFFGRTDPTPEMRADAEAMLADLELPDWGPWELEP